MILLCPQTDQVKSYKRSSLVVQCVKVQHYHCCGWGCCCGTGSIPGPGTFACHGRGQPLPPNKQTKILQKRTLGHFHFLLRTSTYDCFMSNKGARTSGIWTSRTLGDGNKYPPGVTLFLGGLFRVTPEAYGGSQARDQIGATAASLHHSHSNAGSLTS